MGAFSEYKLYHQYEKGSREKTITWHEKNIGYFTRYLADNFKMPNPPLSQFNESNIRSFLMHRVKDDKISPRTSLWHWQAYRAFSRWCLSRRLLKDDPFLTITRPRVDKKLITFLSESEIKAIMAYMYSRRKKRYYLAYLRDYALIATLVYTGIRRGELLGLKLSDIDLDRGLMLLTCTKTRRIEEQPIPQVLSPILKNYIEYRSRFSRPNDDLWICVNRSGWDKRRGKGNFSQRGLQLLMDEINANVKLSHKLVPHLLRRSFATSLLRKTGNIFVVSKLLRHSDISTTVRSYAGTDKRELVRAVEKLTY